jgi:hypothetical protein
MMIARHMIFISLSLSSTLEATGVALSIGIAAVDLRGITFEIDR